MVAVTTEQSAAGSETAGEFVESLMDTDLYSMGAFFSDEHPELVDEVVDRSTEIERAGLAAYAAASGIDVPPALNFGPGIESCQPVRDVVDRVVELVGEGAWEPEARDVPLPEAGVLRLDAAAADRSIGWRPVLDLDTALRWTVEWFRTERAGGDLRALCDEQFDRYRALAAW